jgi:hypothetical protein
MTHDLAEPLQQETSGQSNWLDILRADVKATGSIAETARRVGVSRPAISQVLNRIGHYATGKASTAKLESKVMNSIGLVVCPFLSEFHGAAHRITGLQCREYAYRENAPTTSPREMQHWRACQGCTKRVSPAPEVKELKRLAVPAQKATVGKVGNATSGEEAYQEGWDCIGGPNDCPYPIPDRRSDYWKLGFEQRRDFDKKLRTKAKGGDVQQAGVIDKVTLPLPEVGAPQVQVEEN